ncbi:MAG TPA: hypothetical protein VJ813_19645 [Vicinamibacterales bacterium]|nr:hypothetical protein [Vicinamibacterales bacterium]
MARVNRVISSLMFCAGIALVFAGLSAALGYTLAGMIASVAAIAGLLYAGGIWFGSPATGPGTVLIFDHGLNLTTGTPLLSHFPEPHRPEIQRHCEAALRGEARRFLVRERAFHATPITAADGTVLYGALLEDVLVPAAAGLATLGVQRS